MEARLVKEFYNVKAIKQVVEKLPQCIKVAQDILFKVNKCTANIFCNCSNTMLTQEINRIRILSIQKKWV